MKMIAVTAKYSEIFEKSDNQLINEKSQDLKDLTGRILKNIVNDQDDDSFPDGKIVVCNNLYPRDLFI